VGIIFEEARKINGFFFQAERAGKQSLKSSTHPGFSIGFPWPIHPVCTGTGAPGETGKTGKLGRQWRPHSPHFWPCGAPQSLEKKRCDHQLSPSSSIIVSRRVWFPKCLHSSRLPGASPRSSACSSN
jgi:hypothetical protein